ncbi:MAG: hypothetical protein K0Q99_1760 [Clostridia bacterium]|jgi:hypothetical protein|nr:hypothetical protein [Clostridia bacterium]
MDFEVVIETVESEDLQEQIYEKILFEILNECLSEVLQNEKGHNIFESIN